MDKNEFRDRLAERNFSRRQFSTALASAGLALVTLPVWSRRAAAEGEIEYFTWSEYESPAFHQAYIEKYGGSPSINFFGEEEEALQKLRAGYTPDVTHPCTYSVGRWRDAGVIKAVDTSRLQHYADIWPKLTTIEGTVFDGQPFFVPWDWGNSSILYRTDLVEVEEDSWSLLFDERYAGRLATYDSVDGAVITAALTLGFDNPFSMSDEQLTKVADLMREQRPLLRYYWTDNTAVEQSLATGELVAAYAWNSSVVALKQQGLPVRYMNPKEGILTWVCGLALVKDAPGDEQAAYDFIDAMLAPETGQALIDQLGYGHSNRKSFELVSAERLDELGISSPEALFAQGVFFQPIEPALREKYVTMFERVKAGI
ncbi:extracellular solute-binding protein [Rhodospirillaceae bacterium SYSU D60014]|uniref:ABC transporter substrate-binding protein n=1 Tax=Virgifigura deserti TaxID=2268457 RepID=UPI000E66ECD2